MNSVVLFLPSGTRASDLDAALREARSWERWESGSADSGVGRIYWYRATEIRTEYEDPVWAQLEDAGASNDGCWVIDYSTSVSTMRKLLVALATEWSDA